MSASRKMAVAKKLPQSSAVSQRRTLLSNNWKARNDSSEVNAILQPELDLLSPRRFIREPPDKPIEKKKGVYRKCCLGTNTCYCREKPIKPRILSKPDKCLALDEIGRRMGIDDLSRTSLHCFCKVDSTKIPNSELIRKYNEEIEMKDSSLQLTEQRNDYEVYREDQEEEYLRELAEYKSDKKQSHEVDGNYEDDAAQLKEPNLASVSTVLGTRVADSLTGSSGFITEGLDLDDIRKFREDHYFETHNVEKVQHREIPDHTCIHQFKLDERFLPSALNVDVYGRSRCLICSKPMEKDRVQLSKSCRSSDKMTTNRSMRNLSKCYELGLFPRVINIGGEKSKIALKLSDNQLKFDRLMRKCRRPEYKNTFALRQQKMSC